MVIAPSQAILMLIDKYQKIIKTLDPSEHEALGHCQKMLQELKSLYIEGARTEEQKSQLMKLMQDEIFELRQCTVSFDYKVIHEDPSRRYFESRLALQTLRQHLSEIELVDLRAHKAHAEAYFPNGLGDDAAFLRGEMPDVKNFSSMAAEKLAQKKSKAPKFPEFLSIECADAIQAIFNNSAPFSAFMGDDKEKLSILIQCCTLGVAAVSYMLNNYLFPFADVYSGPLFSPGKMRGRTKKEISQLDVTSTQAGLMTSIMPLARNDVLYREEGFKYLRAADRCYFDKKSTYVIKMFESALNVFSCSISGSLLAQLRLLAQIARMQVELNGIMPDQAFYLYESEKFKNFLRVFISVLLVYGGGHSLMEFCDVLEFPEIRNFFQQLMPDFKPLTVKELFLHGNEAAVDAALSASIEYNNTLLKRAAVHEQIRLFDNKGLKPVDSKSKANSSQHVKKC